MIDPPPCPTSGGHLLGPPQVATWERRTQCSHRVGPALRPALLLDLGQHTGIQGLRVDRRHLEIYIVWLNLYKGWTLDYLPCVVYTDWPVYWCLESNESPLWDRLIKLLLGLWFSFIFTFVIYQWCLLRSWPARLENKLKVLLLKTNTTRENIETDNLSLATFSFLILTIWDHETYYWSKAVWKLM